MIEFFKSLFNPQWQETYRQSINLNYTYGDFVICSQEGLAICYTNRRGKHKWLVDEGDGKAYRVSEKSLRNGEIKRGVFA